jgi:hypothetical protein
MENIKINDKEFILKELKYKDLTGMADISKEEAAKHMIIASTGMTDEEYDNISLKDGINLQQKINGLNGLDEDFQTPLKD